MSVLSTSVRGQWHSCAILRARRAGRGVHRRARSDPMLTGNERVLARVEPLGAGAVLGSDRALYVGGNPGIWQRIGWADIAAVVWLSASTEAVLRLWPVDQRGFHAVRVQADAAFAAFAAERVAATRVLCRRIPILTGTAIVTAVRTPGQDDVIWRVQLDPGCDHNDPAVRRTVQRVITELRELAGC